MHSRRRIVLSLLTLALLAIGPACAQEFFLNDEEVARLPEDARDAYRQGVARVDRVRLGEALDDYIRAAELAPKNADIRFLIGKMGLALGRKEMGDDAIAYLNKAKKAFEEILKLDAGIVSRDDLRRAEKQIPKIDKLIAEQPERDAKRQKIGGDVLKAHLKDIGYSVK